MEQISLTDRELEELRFIVRSYVVEYAYHYMDGEDSEEIERVDAVESVLAKLGIDVGG